MTRSLLYVLISLSVAAVSCREPANDDASVDAGVEGDAASSSPRDDLVPAVGTPRALDIATWNIENFPQRSETAELVASLILSLELDLIGVQEIADTEAFDQLMALLPAYDKVLSTHTYGNGSYQKVGFIYRRDTLRPDHVDLLFTGEYAFPRPPLEVHFDVTDPERGQTILDFTAIVVHLKAGVDDRDRERRTRAVERLDDYLRGQINGSGDDDIVIVGDFNEDMASPAALAVWSPFLDEPGLYTVHTEQLGAEAYSFVPYPRLLDHIVSTVSLVGAFNGEQTQVLYLQHQLDGYTGSVSDHLPVATSMPELLNSTR